MSPRLGTKTLGSEWVGMELDADIYGYRAVNERGEDLGTIQDYVFDENGHMRYLVIETGFWIFGKKILAPVGLAAVDDRLHKVIFSNLDRTRVEDLPEFEGLDDLEPEYEADVIHHYEGRPASVGGRIDYDRSGLFRTPERLRLLEDRMDEDLPGIFPL